MAGNPSPSRRLFGTDGVRGVANSDLDVDLVMGLARAAGDLAGGGTVVVGRDTRRSGPMLVAALQAGFNSVGVDTLDAGVIPIGGVSALVAELGADLGVMVSASHNPAQDNGIKFLDADGFKLDDEREADIEARLALGAPWRRSTGAGVGTGRALPDATDRYLAAIRSHAPRSLQGLRLALDCANGAAHRAAPELFGSLGADVVTFFDDPDGMNINDGCGATSPERLVSETGVGDRIGLCFDGDADRLIAVDEDGHVVNGDVTMAIIALHLKRRGELAGNTVVTTVMSNLGFRRSMREAGIELLETQVGDRYVLAAMREHGAVLGGEQSGHVIQLDRGTTGDGLLTALRLLEVVVREQRRLADLRREAMTEFPQVLVNLAVRSRDLDRASGVDEAIVAAEAELGDDGRVLVRASGTEPVVRVMVEASRAETADSIAHRLAAVVRQELGRT
ncbi:MAG: phosphoglucosamine mutase [Acidimicrobiia bacterium]|nr:phosphoglucosamine mutase [Acidimicrobiia bacterium]